MREWIWFSGYHALQRWDVFWVCNPIGISYHCNTLNSTEFVPSPYEFSLLHWLFHQSPRTVIRKRYSNFWDFSYLQLARHPLKISWNWPKGLFACIQRTKQSLKIHPYVCGHRWSECYTSCQLDLTDTCSWAGRQQVRSWLADKEQVWRLNLWWRGCLLGRCNVTGTGK